MKTSLINSVLGKLPECTNTNDEITIIKESVNILKEEYSDEEINELYEIEINRIDNGQMLENNRRYLELLKDILKETKE
jgi:hypothetical protein